MSKQGINLSEREPLLPRTTRRSRPHPGRQELPADLPRVERVIPCTSEQCQCAACGGPTTVIGYDTSEQLDVEPARHFVVVSRREKRACPHCQRSGIVAAPLPVRIIDKGLVSDRVVIDTVVAKYGDHQPLYRQSAILERETGIEISRATVDGWVMRVGELLIPIAEALRRVGEIRRTDPQLDWRHDISGNCRPPVEFRLGDRCLHKCEHSTISICVMDLLRARCEGRFVTASFRGSNLRSASVVAAATYHPRVLSLSGKMRGSVTCRDARRCTCDDPQATSRSGKTNSSTWSRTTITKPGP